MKYDIIPHTTNPNTYSITSNGRKYWSVSGGNAQAVYTMFKSLERQSPARAQDFVFGFVQGIIFPIVSGRSPQLEGPTLYAIPDTLHYNAETMTPAKDSTGTVPAVSLPENKTLSVVSTDEDEEDDNEDNSSTRHKPITPKTRNKPGGRDR